MRHGDGLGEQVKLVSSLTRSGSSRGQSDSVVNSIRLCLDDAGWRVGSASIVYEDLDDGTEERGSWDPEREAANARRAAADPDVLAYVGTLDADAAPYAIPILNRAGPLLMVSPCNTYPGLTKPVSFAPEQPGIFYPTGKRNYARTAMSDDRQAIGAAQWAYELGAEGVYVLHDGEPYGRGVAEPFADACRTLGIKAVAGPKAITRRAADYRALAKTIGRSGCDLVYYSGIIQSGAGALWRDIREALPAVRMLAPDAIFERAFLADAGEAAEKTLITFGGVPPALLRGKGARFYDRYKQTYGGEPESYAASTYDAVTVILEAIEAAGRKDRQAITEAVLATRNHDGLLGRWSFDANGDIDLSTITRIEVRSGDFAYLETAQLPPSPPSQPAFR
jgi:branched-chain amino acid transport system substrate-binding protein